MSVPVPISIDAHADGNGSAPVAVRTRLELELLGRGREVVLVVALLVARVGIVVRVVREEVVVQRQEVLVVCRVDLVQHEASHAAAGSARATEQGRFRGALDLVLQSRDF